MTVPPHLRQGRAALFQIHFKNRGVAVWVNRSLATAAGRADPRAAGALRILAPELTQKLNVIGVRAGLRRLASCRRLLIELNRRR